MVKFEDRYAFESSEGKKTLVDLFGDQVQLAVYRHGAPPVD